MTISVTVNSLWVCKPCWVRETLMVASLVACLHKNARNKPVMISMQVRVDLHPSLASLGPIEAIGHFLTGQTYRCMCPIIAYMCWAHNWEQDSHDRMVHRILMIFYWNASSFSYFSFHVDSLCDQTFHKHKEQPLVAPESRQPVLG